MKKKRVDTAVLSNGLRLAHYQVPSAVAYCGLTIGVGSRDERPEEHGLAHFLEHLLFKGTKKRKTYHINNRLESVGGELNAFTSKEETVIHAATLGSDFSKAVELISDIAFNSIFPDNEIDREKSVILDEINSYKDSPTDAIFDEFEELIFANSAIGRNILGSKKNLKSLNASHLNSFVDRNYSTNRMVFSSVGRMPFTRVVALVERYLSVYPAKSQEQERNPLSLYQPFHKNISKSNHQAHCIIGNRSYSISDSHMIPLILLTNILGGPLSNSRLNSSLREKLGLVYSVEASCTPYSDTGLFSIYFGTSKSSLDSSINAAMEELQKLSSNKLSSLQLHKAKKQLVGQLAIANESSEQLMLGMGKSLLSLNRIDTVEETLAKISNVTADDLLNVANELFNPDMLSVLSYH